MVAGPVMMDLEGHELSAEEAEMLTHPAVGAVILFARNYRSPGQLGALVDAIRACRPEPLLVTVDQEGGRVQRFRDGFTRLPPLSAIGRLFDEDAAAGLRMAECTGWVMARELREHGVDLSFAPVVDLDHGVSEIIGDRSFHDDPEVVARLARALAAGMHAGGMPATAKHFPGHGAVAPDSHLELPVDERPPEAIRGWDLIPFQRLALQEIPAMMMAHVVYPAVDDLPASFSGVWIRDLLRHGLGFGGAVVADDLCMAAAESLGSPAERARAALDAGCDLLPVCNNRKAVVEVIDAVGAAERVASRQRLERMLGWTPSETMHNQSDTWAAACRRVADLSDAGQRRQE